VIRIARSGNLKKKRSVSNPKTKIQKGTSTMLRRALLALIPLAIFFAQPTLAALGPTDTVKKAIGQILIVLKNERLGRQERWKRIAPIINKNFDFRAMSQSILATHWESASRSEKKQFVEYFSQYLEDTYRRKIEGYADQKIKYTRERVRGGRAIVDTVIVTETTEIPVSYKMRNHKDKWLAYDVVIEGASLVNSYRNLYAALGKTSGVKGILLDLKLRVDENRQNETASGGVTPTSQ
jgi:phospholipid transport system substrate-binding protein